MTQKNSNGAQRAIEKMLFGSKWILILFYFGLIIGQLCYAWVYVGEIWHIIGNIKHYNTSTMMLAVLELVDMALIAYLIKMIITGSYNSSINKNHGYLGENVSSGILKVKLSTSLIGVTSIHLLQSFINSQNIEWEDFYKKMIIHIIFLVGGIALAYIEYLHDKGDAINPHDNDGLIRDPQNGNHVGNGKEKQILHS
jgi:uncharacterized protein (TIGR00645 family)